MAKSDYEETLVYLYSNLMCLWSLSCMDRLISNIPFILFLSILSDMVMRYLLVGFTSLDPKNIFKQLVVLTKLLIGAGH